MLFKACVYYFHQISIFSPNDSPSKNYEKYFLFHLKSSFPSWDIQFFVFLSFPHFLPAGHCFKGWSKINLKVHGPLVPWSNGPINFVMECCICYHNKCQKIGKYWGLFLFDCCIRQRALIYFLFIRIASTVLT